jgi:hypothetical protein
MAQTPEKDETREIASGRIGVLVAVIALVLASGPFVGKAYLRSTVPPVWVPDVSRDARSMDVLEYRNIWRNGATTAGSFRERNVDRKAIGRK